MPLPTSKSLPFDPYLTVLGVEVEVKVEG